VAREIRGALTAATEDGTKALSIFGAAVAGNVASQLLKWYNLEGFDVPTETVARFLGWFVALGLFALFSGWIVTYIWKEKTLQRAFMLGIAMPYLLSGVIADFQGGKVRRAGAEEAVTTHAKPARVPTSGPGQKTPTASILQLHVTAEFEARTLTGTTALIKLRDTSFSVPLESWGNISLKAARGKELEFVTLPPGKYVIEVYTPGYQRRLFEMTLEPDTLTVAKVPLSKAGIWSEVVKGAGLVLLPAPYQMQ
jgi:hypothetical protein